MIYASLNLVNKMLKEAKSAYPFECCGLLVGNSSSSRREVCEIYPVENKNKERAQDRYEIDSKRFDEVDQEAAKKGHSIIGIYHSHPDHPAEPSDFDKECAYVWTEYSYIITSVRNRKETEMRCWYFDKEKKSVEEEKLKIRKGKFLLGLSLIVLSMTVYIFVPVVFFLPLSMKIKASSASISYFLSWGLIGAGLYFTGRDGYENIKRVSKDALRKSIGPLRNMLTNFGKIFSEQT